MLRPVPHAVSWFLRLAPGPDRRMRRILLAAVLSLVPVLGQGQEPAPAPEPESTARRHLGFFLRIDGGAGYLTSSATTSAGTYRSIAGFAMPLGLAAGWAVAENLILAGDLWGSIALSPRIEEAGHSRSSVTSHLILGGAGVQFTWYFMPANLYLSLTPSAVLVGVTESGVLSRSKVGFGAKAGLGKEWWVADHWGIGLAAQVVLAWNQDEAVSQAPPTWSTLGGALALSVTYN